MCLDNSMAPNRRQAIIWTNADLIHWRLHVALGGHIPIYYYLLLYPTKRHILSHLIFLFHNRRRLNARIAELEDNAEQARARAAKLDKEKTKLSVEIREITVELETVCAHFRWNRSYVMLLINVV